MVLEVRGGGVIPLPYLIEKQRYNLTDEIVQRLRHYKDFNELKKEIEKEDANNDLVIEILSQGVSMINESGTKVKKEKIRGKEPGTSAKDVIKPASTTSAMKIRTTPNLPFRHRISSKATARSPSKSSRRKNAMLIWPRTTTSTKRKPSSVKNRRVLAG